MSTLVLGRDALLFYCGAKIFASKRRLRGLHGNKLLTSFVKILVYCTAVSHFITKL